ncbi:alpha/beta hydrolase family protein [Caballeronia sp. KNU42]
MSEVQPTPVTIHAEDGYALKGQIWRHDESSDAFDAGGPRPVVIINPATSVRCGYYSRFAAFLHAQGFDVITYDYRGIGGSRPASLRSFHAGWLDWGRLDFEAVLRLASGTFARQPIQVVAHSIGGVLVGLAPSNHLIERVFTMGAQFAHWRDYASNKRFGMLIKWHAIMPALTAALGYFPGGKLGWMEDTPRGVVCDWIAPQPRFEDAFRRGPHALTELERATLVEGFAAMHGPMLALSVTDDEFGTESAIERLLAYFRNSPITHLRIPPESMGYREIGHFAFFHSRFEASLWQIPLEWLKARSVRADLGGFVVRTDAR